VPVWITSLAFIAANLARRNWSHVAGAKYGIMTAHFYWIGAIPASCRGNFHDAFYYAAKPLGSRVLKMRSTKDAHV